MNTMLCICAGGWPGLQEPSAPAHHGDQERAAAEHGRYRQPTRSRDPGDSRNTNSGAHSGGKQQAGSRHHDWPGEHARHCVRYCCPRLFGAPDANNRQPDCRSANLSSCPACYDLRQCTFASTSLTRWPMSLSGWWHRHHNRGNPNCCANSGSHQGANCSAYCGADGSAYCGTNNSADGRSYSGADRCSH